MRFNAPVGTDAYNEPNSFHGPREDVSAKEPPLAISGDAARYDHRIGGDDYTQPGILFRMFDEGQRHRLFHDIAAAMTGVPREIIDRQIAHFSQCDPAYGAGVAQAVRQTHEPSGNSAPASAGQRPRAAQ